MNQAPTSFSIFDSSIVSKSPSENINTEKEFQVDLHLFGEELRNQSYVNKYKPYTFTLPGVDEDCMLIAFNIMKQISFVEKGYHSLLNSSAQDAYNFGDRVKSTLLNPYNSVSSRLMKLATTLPTKGRDGPLIVKWYKETYKISTINAEIRAIRDFYSSVYFWQFITVADPIILDNCGSIMCLSLAEDYPGSSDDCQCGGIENFLAATNDGIRSLNFPYTFPHVAVAIDDIIKTCAFMRIKAFVTSDNKHSNDHPISKFNMVLPCTVTPSRFMELRWWDAAMAPYHRLIIGCSSRDMGIKIEDDGIPLCVEKCVRIRRAIDSIIRYNEMVDILSDVRISEHFNEVLVAFSMSGHSAIKGYAEAVASVIEDVVECNCDTDGHEWAASLAIGCCCWYAIVPRYQMLQQLQLAAREKIANASDMDIQWGPFLSVQKCKLDNLIMLHRNDWEPVWRFEISRNDDFISTYDVHKFPCSMCMSSAIALSVRILVQKRSFAIKSNLPATIYELIGCSSKRDGSGYYQCVSNEAHIYAAIWQRICLNLYDNGCTEKAPQEEVLAAASAIRNIVESFCLAMWQPWEANVDMPLSVQLFTSMDKAMRDTYSTTIVGDGIWRRRLLMGLIGSFLEFSPVRAYASICEYAFGK